MYLFKGKPNMLVKTKQPYLFNNKITYKPLFRFDKNGEYRTDDDTLIKKLKGRFDHVEIKDGETKIEVIEEEETIPFYEPKNTVNFKELSIQQLWKIVKANDITVEKRHPSKAYLVDLLERTLN